MALFENDMIEGKKNNNIFRTMLSVSGIVVLAKILGFVKQMITANAFGATIHTDIISLSEGLVANLDYLMIQALATAFIPTYISAKANDDQESRVFVSNTITVFFVVSLLISITVIAGAPFISRILAPSYSAENSVWLAKYLRIFAPVLVLIVELAIFNALLKANEIFVPGELIGLNQSVILIILVLTIGQKIGPDTLVVAFYVYAIFNLVFLMSYSRGYWSLLRGNPMTDQNIKKLLLMMGPLLFGFAMVFINQQVDKIIVSGLGEGTVTAMNYAAVLSNFVSTFVGSICGVLFTYITQNIVEKKDQDAAKLTMNAACQIGTLLLPISIVTIVCANDIVNIVFGRGKFNTVAVENCSRALIGYGFMFVPYVIRELFSRFQYAYGDSKKPMVNSTIAIIFNIVCSIILSRYFGVLGVSLATSISVLISAVLNVAASSKKNSNLRSNMVINHATRWIMGAVVCFLISYEGTKLLENIGPLIRFVMISLLALSAYFVVTFPIVKPLLRRFMHRK